MPIRLLAFMALACLFAPAPAQALVGPSTEGAAVAPYVVMVLNRTGSVAGYCSGLVVAPDAVLTAAHCVPPGAAVKVHYRDAANQPILLDTAEVVRSPAYRANAIKTRQRSIDLALIRLPVPLPQPFTAAAYGDGGSPAVGTAYRLAGFGLTREGDAASSGHLRLAKGVARAPLSNILLWARDPDDHGAGACTGDSGGPVFAEQTDRAVALMVWSAGKGAAQCGALTQAVWLGPQKGWIDGVLAGWHASR
jgi:Trypsin